MGKGQEKTPGNYPLIVMRGFFYRLVRLLKTIEICKEKRGCETLSGKGSYNCY
jgi:hypothetical protein